MRFVFEGSLEEFKKVLNGSLLGTETDGRVLQALASTTVTPEPAAPAPAPASPSTDPDAPAKRGRGRPKGSGKKEAAAPPVLPSPPVSAIAEEDEPPDDDFTDGSGEEEEEAPADKVDKADLTIALENLIAQRGVPVAKTLLGEFGVPKLGDLSEKFYPAFLRRAMELGA